MNIDGNRSSKAEKDKSRRFNSNMRERIQSLIQDNGFTIKTFAEKIKINPSTFNKYFSGTKFPCDVVASIAQHFHVSVDYLFGINGYESDDSSKDISLSASGFPQSIIDELSHMDAHSVKVLAELLENGILQDILSIFEEYNESVSSLCTAYSVARSCEVASQAMRTEAERMGALFMSLQRLKRAWKPIVLLTHMPTTTPKMTRCLATRPICLVLQRAYTACTEQTFASSVLFLGFTWLNCFQSMEC